MNEELIRSVANLLEEWNPLADKASSVSDLNGYRTEAIDILSSSRILNLPIRTAVETVLSQAFGLSLDGAQLNHYSKLIEQIVNTH